MFHVLHHDHALLNAIVRVKHLVLHGSPEENCSATISSNETQQLMSSNQALKASSGTSSAGTSRLTRLLKTSWTTHPATHPSHKERKFITLMSSKKVLFLKAPLLVYKYVQCTTSIFFPMASVSVGTLYLQCILPGSCWHPLLCYPISLLPREGQCSTWWGLSQQKGHPESISFVTLKLWLVSDPVFLKKPTQLSGKTGLDIFVKKDAIPSPGASRRLTATCTDSVCGKFAAEMSFWFSK